MKAGFLFVLIAIALRTSFANPQWNYPQFTEPFNLTQVKKLVAAPYDLILTQESLLSLLGELYHKYVQLEEKSKMQEGELYHKYMQLEEMFTMQDDVITMLRSYASKCKELNQLQSKKNDYFEDLVIFLPAASSKEKDSEACKTQLNRKTAIITSLESQLEFCNSTLYENEKLKTQLQSKEMKNKGTQTSKEQISGQIPSEPAKIRQGLDLSLSMEDRLPGSTGIASIEVPSLGQVKVLCNDLAGPGWIVIQRRIDGETSFFRQWSEYREGFGNLTGEFFIGLEPLHQLTSSKPYELYIQLVDFEGEVRFARYDNFRVGNENASYKLQSLGEYSGDAGDGLSHNLYAVFSTFDRDSPDQCATRREGAWWYGPECGFSNINGRYSRANEDYDSDGVGLFWHNTEWHEFTYSMKSVHMMIRPKASELKNKITYNFR